jgi:hypothetical protein
MVLDVYSVVAQVDVILCFANQGLEQIKRSVYTIFALQHEKMVSFLNVG